MKIKYTKNYKILHIQIGDYHALISWNAGIIRNHSSGNARWLWGWK